VSSQHESPTELIMVTFVEPHTLGEAAALAEAHEWDGKLICGGTAVVLMLQQGFIAPDVLISLRKLNDVPGWEEIALDDGWLHIGAGVSLSQVAAADPVRRAVPSLAEAARVVGNVRIRNAATLGGNIAEADYASDPPAVLVNLGAEIEVRSRTARRIVPAADMFTDFYTTDLDLGEIVTAVRVPVPAPRTRHCYVKFRSRSAEDRPCVGVAASLRMADDTVASLDVVVGAVSGTPQRWVEITEGAVGRVLDRGLTERVADQYADAVDPIDDARGSTWYRREMVRVLVRRCIQSLARGEGGSRG
jgi:carbon-monoxide dehydrogenase medium subunit